MLIKEFRVNIAIGADHGGFKLKQALISYLIEKQYNIFDAGVYQNKRCDYPDFSKRVTKMVSNREAQLGILICKSGIGMSIAANRIKGMRAALCHNTSCAKYAKRHNNANILVLGSNYVKRDLAKRIFDIFTKEKFVGGRHARRVKKLDTK